MKPIYILKIIALTLFTSFFVGCSSDDDGKDVTYKIDPVSNLITIAGEKKITLSWDNPKSTDLSHILIRYEEAGKIFSEQVPSSASATGTFTINAIDMLVYKFVVEAVTKNGDTSEPVIVKGKTIYESNSLEYDIILSSIRLMPNGGVKVLWSNDNNLEADIVVSYEVNNSSQKAVFKANSLIKEGYIENLPTREDIEFTVKVIDKVGDTSTSTLTFRITPQEVKLQNKGWTVTTTSEIASTGAGAAINLIDGDPNTYWQSIKAASSDKFYCEVVIDLKEVKTISKLSLERKFGDSAYSSWDNNIALSKDGVNWDVEYKYSNSATEPMLKVEFNRTIDGEQYYRLPEYHEARYVRLAATRSSSSALVALFGELNIYGY